MHISLVYVTERHEVYANIRKPLDHSTIHINQHLSKQPNPQTKPKLGLHQDSETKTRLHRHFLPPT
jgi:hypothetical protein